MENIIRFLTPKKATQYMDDESTIRQALEKFDIHKFSIVPLIDKQGKYKGTVSEGDILRFIKNNSHFDLSIAENVRLSEIEHYRPYRSLKVDASFEEIFALSLEQNFIPITDDYDTFIGIIRRRDVILSMKEKASN